MPSLLDLPHHAISRILFERWKIDSKYTYILSILYTCKQLYYDHYYVLFLLAPLVLGKATTATSSKSLHKLAETGVNCKIKSVYFVQPTKAIIQQTEMFSTLVSVSISTSLNDLLSIVYKLPSSVTELSLCVTKNGMRSRPPETVLPAFKLKKLTFKSICCIRRSNFFSFYDTIKGPLTKNVTDLKYYKRHSPGRVVCNLLSQLIQDNISTLVLLEMETINLDQLWFQLKDHIPNNNNKIAVIKVNHMATNLEVIAQLIKICKEMHYTNNLLGHKWIWWQNEDGALMQKVVATK